MLDFCPTTLQHHKKERILHSILQLISHCYCWPKAGLSTHVWERLPFILVPFILFKVTFKLCMEHLRASRWTQLFLKQRLLRVHEPLLDWLSLIPAAISLRCQLLSLLQAASAQSHMNTNFSHRNRRRKGGKLFSPHLIYVSTTPPPPHHHI